MKITFEKKKTEKDHLVFIYKNKIIYKKIILNNKQIDIQKNSNLSFKGIKEITETLNYSVQTKKD